MAKFSLLSTAAAVAIACQTACAQTPVQLRLLGTNALELRNGFSRMVFNLNRGSVDLLQGRFEGDGQFEAWGLNDASPNLSPYAALNTPLGALPNGLKQGAVSVIVTGDGNSMAETATSAYNKQTAVSYTVLSNTSDYAAFSVNSIVDGPYPQPGVSTPRVSTTFTFSLAAADRGMGINTTVTALQTFNTTAVRISTAWTPADAVGIYESGVRQGMLMSQSSGLIASKVPWHRWYGMGYSGAVDILPISPAPNNYPSIMYASEWNKQRSGLDIVLAGNAADDSWVDGIENWGSVIVNQGTVWNVAIKVFPNNYDFPTSPQPATGPISTVQVNDIRSILTGIYGSPMSALHSYDYTPEARIAPCIEREGHNCYDGDYNFFDPDSFLSIDAMVYSFDFDVTNQARLLLETNERYLCPAGAPANRCQLGQAMHHFVPSCDGSDPKCICVNNQGVQDCLTYAAISGAIQTGPNIFWMLAALRYASATGNYTWLQAHMPSIRFSADFLLNAFDKNVGLLNVGNSLWIDTFIRANYTTDTNAGAVILFERMADAELFLGNQSGSTFYANLAETIRGAMLTYLWSPQNDHFCTQSDPVPGQPGKVNICTRDFVDYDSNLLAVAAGAVNGSLAQALLNRIDAGPCTHQHATWVSEIFYDAANCNSGNTGDSAISMGRISWADAMARKRMGDAANAAVFTDLVLGPVQYELLANTWMNERYQCQGLPAHSDHYIEMPEIVGMMLVEVKYGIELGFNFIGVDPIMGFDAFDFAVGTVGGASATGIHIGYYNHTGFTATVPYTGPAKQFVVGKMQQGSYNIAPTGQNVNVGADGILRFTGAAGAGVTVTATKTA